MKILATLMALIACNAARAEKLQFAWEKHQILAVLEIVDPSNGIDATEARALAEACFLKNVGGCGGLCSVQRDGKWWVFETLEGPSGVAGQPVRVHTEVGWITKKGGELLRPPWKSLLSWFKGFVEATEENEEPDQPAPAKEPTMPNKSE